MFRKQIGIDLGTVNVLVYVNGQGIVIQEPSVVAVTVKNDRIVLVGRQAQEMLGRVPDAFNIIRPLRKGVISNYRATEQMLVTFVERVAGWQGKLFAPELMVSTPVGVTSVERRAVERAARQAAGRRAYIIEEPLAAAIGAGLPVATPTGNMVLNIGGGTAEAAVISMNGIVNSSSVRVGGLQFDEDITNYLRRKYSLIVGEHTAEQVKIQLGSAITLDEEILMEVKGRDQISGLPRSIKISTQEVTEAISESLQDIAGMVRVVLEETPPELAADIIDRGIIITGGGALLRHIDKFMTQQTNVPCYAAEQPMACVALGAGQALRFRQALQRARNYD